MSTDYSFREELREAEEKLHALQIELARLVGFHSSDGAVPVTKVLELLNGKESK